MNHAERLRRILYRDAIVRKRSFLCDNYMLPGNDKQTVREINILNLAKHF